ncbi:hypothetical protein DH2020_017215 [Rehmannia glutinosa]|uniref:MADS-box domain-containing protein n=1 Tax=Rehmannia glutinosa TaxID=99300 RepID=A0ABR0WR53_REHGL
MRFVYRSEQLNKKGKGSPKASELNTLYGAEIVVVVFSPGNKAHSFGHPNVETISSRFLNENGPSTSDADKLLEDHHKANISQQALELDQLERQLYLEKKHARELKQARKVDINKLDYDQLRHLEGAIRNFQQEFEAKVQNATNFQMPRSSIGPSFVAPFNSDHV